MTTNLAQVMELPSSWDNYTRLGWALTLIPPGTKGSRTPGWNKREFTITDASKIPAGYGAGLCHAYSGTCAIDIDDWNQAVTALSFVGIDLNALIAAPDAVTIESGNPGHGKLIYQMPFGLSLPSKKCIYTTAEGIKKNYLDFRCATADDLTVQDVLPPSVHPVTQRPYKWGGRGSYTNLPMIPIELLSYWRSIIKSEDQRNIKVAGTHVSASWSEIKSALATIDPDCSRDEWITVLMALHYAGTLTNKLDEAFVLADEWSSQSVTKYKGQRDILNSWRGFTPDKGVTLGSLFHLAGKSGWRRPAPDVSTLFSPTEGATSPKSLREMMHTPAPSINYDLLPPLLATRAKEVSVSIGCDPLVPAWAGLAAAAAAIDAQIRLELMPGFKVPPVLWLVTVGPPADRKTPGARPMLSILKTLEGEDIPRQKAAELFYEAQAAAHAEAKKDYLAAAKSPEFVLSGQDEQTLPYMPPEPKPPHPLRLTVSDITSQKLVRMCADRPRGVLCHLDEMKSWAAKMNGSQGTDSRSTWVKGYECDSETMDRVGNNNSGADNSIIATNFAVSMFGNIQPRVFRAYLKDLSEDGLIQRFVPAILRPELSDVKGEPIPEHLTSAERYEQHIRLLYALPVTTYRLSTDAYNQYRAFQDWFLALKKDERLIKSDDIYMTALGKIEGTCGRIILFWHLFDNPQSSEVSGETAKRAIAFVQTYVIQAFRYTYNEVGGLINDGIEQRVTDYILQRASLVDTITMSDIRRSLHRVAEGQNLSYNEVKNQIRDAMINLEAAHWVKIVDNSLHSTVWAIDPRLADIFKDDRRDVIKAKQRILDTIHAISKGAFEKGKAVGSATLEEE